MHLDVQDLRNFYYRSTLGRAAQTAVRGQLLRMWPDATGETVAGFGFAAPLLRPYLPEARRIMALMPGPQGVMQWPAGLPNVSVLCEETSWPVETGRVDRLVVLHGLETSERPSDLLDECWRVLGPGGRAIFIVPNRGGFWARSDATPFGYGRPYTLTQVENQLRGHQFAIEQHAAALYRPPSQRRFWLKSGAMIERMGHRLPAMMAAGVFLVEVSKQTHPQKGHMIKTRRANPIRVLEGLSNPTAEPA
ncbi:MULTISPECIES: class I SAM-dependent methyltransferase [unclassified Epibacterium]|jgi:SAM-dependent methyltransferase|uniref:class I SAM-dependent methyltransferase n=1 Tax=unclassified Epibacterium TaxID=2639179 RepID=UPI001EF561E2|nr:MULTISPECIES: class I SAM-dependent methyltransferase [unclassified Epibacterium]MCG7622822.1 class I SAM-dependent methyltransferase [Epibacterium sp. Ofav1-8]MCG7627679.1 class I SAM-dependent methyltransferase [Epibacterium sp. MM17-32]